MPSLHSVGRQLDTRLQRFATKQWQPAPPVMLQRSSYVMPASSADWRAVHRRAVAERARARTGLAQVRPLQRELASLGQQAESFTEQAAPGWTPLRSRPDWTELRQSILDDAPGTMTRADVERLVEVVGKRDAGHMRAQVLAPIHEVAADLSDTSESWHAALVGAELAEALASFNSGSEPPCPSPGNWTRSYAARRRRCTTISAPSVPRSATESPTPSRPGARNCWHGRPARPWRPPSRSPPRWPALALPPAAAGCWAPRHWPPPT